VGIKMRRRGYDLAGVPGRGGGRGLSAVVGRVKVMKRIELTYPSDPRVVQEVRRRFEEFVHAGPLSRDDVEDMKVALSEACANAICHGSPNGPRNCFHVTCLLSRDELVMEVADEGAGFAAGRRTGLPEEFAASGRGIFLMEHLCDRVEVEPRRPGTAVRLIKRLPVAGGPAEAAESYQASAQPSRRGSLPPNMMPARASC
jgi:serine/threonine-protein kinase RsbW